MNDTTNPHHLPAAGGDDIDVIPGVPPVAITVWRTPTEGGAETPISDRLARRLVGVYTDPGATVVDLTDTTTVARAAVDGDRTHLRAVFADRTIVVTDTHPANVRARKAAQAGKTRFAPGEPIALADWFGDDLRHGTTRPSDPIDAARPGRDLGRADLLLALWPLHPNPTTNTTRLADLMAAAVRILRPGGHLVFVGAVDGTRTGDFSELITAAHTAGLAYLQHLVSVTADIDGDHFVYHASPHDLQDVLSHVKVHIDVIVLAARPGGGRRG